MSANTTIYVGFWNNHAKGAVVGSTLTLSNRNGAVLIAALALFLQVCTSLGAFVVHCFPILAERNCFDAISCARHCPPNHLINLEPVDS